MIIRRAAPRAPGPSPASRPGSASRRSPLVIVIVKVLVLAVVIILSIILIKVIVIKILIIKYIIIAVAASRVLRRRHQPGAGAAGKRIKQKSAD